MLSEAQRDMKAKGEFLNPTLVEGVRSVIQKSGRENGSRYTLDGGQRTALFADGSLNITEAVLKKPTEDR